MLFASAGYRVALFDVDPGTTKDALDSVRDQLTQLEATGMLRGSLTVEEQCASIEAVISLEEAIRDAVFVEECVFEVLELKKSVLGEIDNLVGDDVTIASSASALVPSLLSESLTHRKNFIITHPTNPPFYARCVELVPAPWTSGDVIQRTRTLMEALGQNPVVLKKEIDGFLVNRLHFALMAESWRLVKGGYISAEGLGRVVSSGLGPRYAFMGPFQTAHLNASGFADYCQKYGDMIYRVQQSFGPCEPIGGEAAEAIHQELVQTFAKPEDIEEKRKWRFSCLAALAKLKRDLAEEEGGENH